MSKSLLASGKNIKWRIEERNWPGRKDISMLNGIL